MLFNFSFLIPLIDVYHFGFDETDWLGDLGSLFAKLGADLYPLFTGLYSVGGLFFLLLLVFFFSLERCTAEPRGLSRSSFLMGSSLYQ